MPPTSCSVLRWPPVDTVEVRRRSQNATTASRISTQRRRGDAPCHGTNSAIKPTAAAVGRIVGSIDGVDSLTALMEDARERSAFPTDMIHWQFILSKPSMAEIHTPFVHTKSRHLNLKSTPSPIFSHPIPPSKDNALSKGKM